MRLPRQPMRLAVSREPFHHPDWIWELKYDGFRALARVSGGRADLISRRGNVYKSFAPLCAGLARALAGREAVLDGEIVCLNDRGRPPPLLERKAELRRIVPAAGSRLLYARHLDAEGVALFELVCREDLEGIVGKWKPGPYLDGAARASTWMKVKNPVYSQIKGRHELFERRAAFAR